MDAVKPMGTDAGAEAIARLHVAFVAMKQFDALEAEVSA
jgi:hypothetical protein